MACPPLPPALEYLWLVFLRLSNRRGGGGFGPQPISWADLSLFGRLSGMRLVPWEVELIELLDVLYLNERADRHG